MIMLTVTTLVNVQNMSSVEQVVIGGMLATISLIISLSMAEVLVESKWWNKWASNTLEICNTPLLVVFAAIVALKIL
ncbi:MAG: hypothetical protein C4B59_08955 [Candidatus Methanogaster sp.]|uniref:Uncharacterized protein n=1 Tax=Candidatus Methanogaster sp. TaxID=3386292 RepID=A0AC61L1Y4_9EURY|nr:MAG: hypothetical protein C4B59_08955 [ANME-2 cluster archaeon]